MPYDDTAAATPTMKETEGTDLHREIEKLVARVKLSDGRADDAESKLYLVRQAIEDTIKTLHPGRIGHPSCECANCCAIRLLRYALDRSE